MRSSIWSSQLPALTLETSQEPYFSETRNGKTTISGLILRGVFDEEVLFAAIQQSEGGSLSTESYKSRDLHIPQDDTDSFGVYIVGPGNLAIGQSRCGTCM